MSWNDQDAQNARNDAQNGSYYPHDITDMNDNLDGWCIWTNFPSPYYDWDDDGDSIFKWEESEVVSVDTNFPPANTNYSVNSYFTRWTEQTAGSTNPFWVYDGDGGTINIIPQTSRWNWVIREYNTDEYDEQPVEAGYGDNSQSIESEIEIQEPLVRDVTSVAFGDSNEYIVHIATSDEHVFVKEMSLQRGKKS
ncbi:MAG: hypothetical protein GFH27_549279n352 [Chloroflexi bacterium AL-W]|nr:hypothetical protein [Chloroflexi bacterium AL-N1]NOK65318.1 hypothetical protein [Chloroflexi bacterium AL-N10]NOK72417.1 hypothetical protein [Chloroflexi bacterium AL-N5]NOK79497.1 hypothetical protein [Chloroflexi bacterium AL-W]NOK87413.1 hypothetical protein [Chloroflexi bacterium AL-N15]